MGELKNLLLNYSALTTIFVGIFWAILFIQSGLDKVFDWKGNLEWLKGHFGKSILKSMVSPLLLILTLIELSAGFISAIGVVYYLISGRTQFILIGLVLSLLSLLMLFFGQRIAKDYDGAKTIAIYFGVALISLLILK